MRLWYSEQDISLSVDTYFRFGIVKEYLSREKYQLCLYRSKLDRMRKSMVVMKWKLYIYIYGGETGLAPIMYVMGINILSYLVTGRKIGFGSVQVL